MTEAGQFVWVIQKVRGGALITAFHDEALAEGVLAAMNMGSNDWRIVKVPTWPLKPVPGIGS